MPTGAACCNNLTKAKDVVVGDTVWTVEADLEPELRRALNVDKQHVDLAVPRKVSALSTVRRDGLHSPVLEGGGMPIVDGFATAFDRIEVVKLASFGLAWLMRACEATGTCTALHRLVHG